MRMTSFSIEEAQAIALSAVHTVFQEELPLVKCAGRVLAQDVRAKVSSPPFRRSAMDGYAVRCEDLAEASQDHRISLSVTGCNDAGIPKVQRIGRGEAARIMTGGVVPEGADAVVRQEDVEADDSGMASFASVPKTGQCISPVGEDVAEGETIACAGDPADASALAAAASAGVTFLPVYAKVRAAVLCTGDELILPGSTEAMEPGQIYGSSHIYLWTRLAELGCEIDMEKNPLVGDDPDRIAERIRDAVRGGAQIVLTTGGVSAGRKDYLPEVISGLGGEILFHGIEIKPGMPTMLSLVEGVPVLSLSGNPYSCICMFELLGRPMIRKMRGERNPEDRTGVYPAADEYPRKSPSRRILRGYFDGMEVFFSMKQRNSQIVAGVGHNCLIDIPAGNGIIEKGSQVRVILI